MPDFNSEFSLSCAILFTAYLVRGVAGFGSGLIAIPLLALTHPLPMVVPLVVSLDFLGSAAQGIKSHTDIQWKELAPLLPFTLTGCAMALYLFQSIEANTLNFSLGIFIIVFAVYQILPLPPIRGPRYWAGPAGMLGGLLGTLFGTGGPFYMIYLTMRGLGKSQTRASFAAYFFIDGSIRLTGFLVIGLLNQTFFITLLQWLPAAAIGLYIGGKVHVNLTAQTFKYFISLLLVVSGYRLITK